MNTVIPTKRKNKVATTIRLDPDLKEWARNYAHHSGIDLSTFITVTLTQVKHTGKSVELYDPRAIAYNQYLDDMIEDAEK